MSELLRSLAAQAIGRASQSVRPAAIFRSMVPLGFTAAGSRALEPFAHSKHDGRGSSSSLPGPWAPTPGLQRASAQSGAVAPNVEGSAVETFERATPVAAPGPAGSATMPDVGVPLAGALEAALAWVSQGEEPAGASGFSKAKRSSRDDRANEVSTAPARAEHRAAATAVESKPLTVTMAPADGEVGEAPGTSTNTRPVALPQDQVHSRPTPGPFAEAARPRSEAQPAEGFAHRRRASAASRHRGPSYELARDLSTATEPNEVHVHIGRIELTAVPEAAPRRARPAPAGPSVSLRDYLNGVRRSR